MMNKEEWHEARGKLISAYGRFCSESRDLSFVKNPKTRKEAEKAVERIAKGCEGYVRLNPEIYSLFVGGDTEIGFSSMVIMGDFRRPDKFGKLVLGLIRKIEEKIKTLE